VAADVAERPVVRALDGTVPLKSNYTSPLKERGKEGIRLCQDGIRGRNKKPRSQAKGY